MQVQQVLRVQTWRRRSCLHSCSSLKLVCSTSTTWSMSRLCPAGSTGAVCEETVEISLLQLVEGLVVLVRGWFLGPCTQVQGRGRCHEDRGRVSQTPGSSLPRCLASPNSLHACGVMDKHCVVTAPSEPPPSFSLRQVDLCVKLLWNSTGRHERTRWSRRKAAGSLALSMAPSREDDGSRQAGDGPPPQCTARSACGGRAERGGRARDAPRPKGTDAPASGDAAGTSV